YHVSASSLPLLLFFSVAPPSTSTYTLSLHDALPISSRPRTRSTTKAPSRCPKRSSTGSCCGSRSATRAGRGSWRCWIGSTASIRSEEHTSELQSRENLVCRLLLEKKKNT